MRIPPTVAMCVSELLCHEFANRILETEEGHVQAGHLLCAITNRGAEFSERQFCESRAKSFVAISKVDASTLKLLK